MGSALDTALALDRRLRERTAPVHRQLGNATVVRDPQLSDVHYLNAVLLSRRSGALGAEDVVGLADRALDGCPHRHAVFDDADQGERIAEVLAQRGWERERTLFMALSADRLTGGGDAMAVGGDARARLISEADARELEARTLAEEVPAAAGRSGLLGRLIETARRRRSVNECRCFGAGDGDALQSMGTLFVEEDVGGRRVAMVESVGTLVAHRERGLARAVVGAATAAARDWGAELLVIPADADDWPQLMYARLGFAPLGQQVAITREP